VPIDASLIPDNEQQRLAAVQRYDVLDTPRDGAFERITKLAARHFRVPVAIVSIVDSDRIWFKSHHGIDVEQIDREPGLCASAILGEEPWVVENAAIDPRTLANPLVAGEMGLRFYAGAPLKTRDGFNLGTLCVIDQQPREFSDEDAEILTELAEVVVDELELRLAARRTVGEQTALREQAEHLARELQASLLPPKLPTLDGAEISALYLPADAAVVGGDFYDAFAADDGWILAVGDVSGKGARAAAVTGLARHTVRSAAQWAPRPAAILENLNSTMLLDQPSDDVEHYCTLIVVFAQVAGDGFRLTFASAGHPPALIVRGDGSCEEVSGSEGPPVGWHADPVYPEVIVEISPGDRVLMYTDGLTEARRSGGFLGVSGVREIICHLDRDESIVQALAEAARAPGVTVSDDLAALVLRVE
jgi:sigma-B regulation protein RsbU (phosphoserine phosphatase)